MNNADLVPTTTLAHQDGVINVTNVAILDISESGPNMTFRYAQQEAPPDDEFEDNDVLEDAQRLELGQYQLQGLDDDWFLVETEEGWLQVAIDGEGGNLDLFLYDAGGVLLDESLDFSSIEHVFSTTAGGTYLIAVRPFAGQTAAYVLDVQVTAVASALAYRRDGVQRRLARYSRGLRDTFLESIGAGYEILYWDYLN